MISDANQANQFIMLRLNKEKKEANLVIDGKTHNFNLNIENGEQIISHIDNHIEYDPIKNVIIGIDRGGAIVGAMLGKKLHLPATTIAINWAKPQGNFLHHGVGTSLEFGGGLKSIDVTAVQRVLLVDDAIRTGMNMTSAINILKNTIQSLHIQYNTLCILYQIQLPNHGIVPNIHIYNTNLAQIKMPWDEKDKDFDEFNRLCRSMPLEEMKAKI